MSADIPGIRHEAVSAWLASNVPEIQGPLQFEHIKGGRSNLTYKVTDANHQAYILRRPPLGAVLETAHDVAREFRIMAGVGQATGDLRVPVPRTIITCDDPSVNDAPFTIVDYIDGVVLHLEADAINLPEEERYAVGLDLIDVLARLHLINPDDVGLGQLGRREGYIERQLRRWSRQWEAMKERELPAMDAARDWLNANVPTPQRVSIVHGDYRAGNTIVKDGRVQAVLDWELSTLGDPLADVGYLLNNWAMPSEDAPWERPPTLAGGFPDRDTLIDAYAAKTGFDMSEIDFYRVFAYWRFCAILEGVRLRYKQGAHGKVDIDLDALGQSVVSFADMAYELIT